MVDAGFRRGCWRLPAGRNPGKFPGWELFAGGAPQKVRQGLRADPARPFCLKPDRQDRQTGAIMTSAFPGVLPDGGLPNAFHRFNEDANTMFQSLRHLVTTIATSAVLACICSSILFGQSACRGRPDWQAGRYRRDGFGQAGDGRPLDACPANRCSSSRAIGFGPDIRGANAVACRLSKETQVTLGPGSLVELVSPSRIRIMTGEVKVAPGPKTDIEIEGPDQKRLTIRGLADLPRRQRAVGPALERAPLAQGL